MNLVWDILQKPDTVAVFDVDGTLFSYNYGTFHAHHDLDDPAGEAAFRQIDMYADARGLPPLRDYIRAHGTDLVYCLSLEPHGHEEQKAAALYRYYGIPADHCLFVKRSEEKPEMLQRLGDRLGAADRLVYIDDNELVLRLVEQQTDFYTAHVTIFFEEPDTVRDRERSETGELRYRVRTDSVNDKYAFIKEIPASQSKG